MDPSSRDMGTWDRSGDQDPSPCQDHDQSNPSTQQQPQVKFDDYSPDAGLFPLSVGQPPIFASDDSWAYGGFDIGDEQGDAKRRRIARACDACRRKKIRCDAKMPKCSHCENYKTECIFTHVEKKRAQPKGAKYIEGLENRLGRMEHLLRLSGLLSEDDEEGADLGTLEQRLAQQVNSNRDSPRSITSGPDQPSSISQRGDGRRTSPQRSGMHSPTSNRSSPKLQHGDQKVRSEERESAKVRDKDVDDLADMMWCSLVTNSQGETRFIGSSSGFSIFSPRGVQWVSEKTGDDSFVNMITALSQDDNKWYPWREEVFGDIFARRVFKPLPPREECESLIEEFFESFNTMFPLFHEPTFRHLVDMQYSEEPYDGSGWWASLNVALAIAYRIRRLKVQPPGGEESVSWAYFKNALAVLSELTLRNTDLLSVQALIGMCLFLQGSPNPQPSFYLIGAAFRLAHSIGLHKHGSGFGLNEAEVEQRKRVFWIAYMIDKDISLRSGRPPAQDDDDWNVELPSENPKDGFGTVPVADGTKTNLFHTLCRFAVISAKVYNKLYSVKAARQSDGELLSTIGELDAELEAWKDSIPLDFRPEHELTALPTHLVIHIVILHFAYYNCLTTIHRRSVHHGYWTSRLSDYAVSGLNVKPLNPRVFSSAALCVSAARTSIHLIKYIPRHDYAFVWLILYYPVSSLVTLFANILQNPQDARARSDLKLVGVVVDFLHKITLEDPSGSMQRMHAVCRNFQRIAGLVLDKAEQDMTTSQKRKQEREREKIAKRPHEPVELPQPIRRSTEMQNGVDSSRATSQASAKQQQPPHIQFSLPRQNNDGSGASRISTQMSSANLDNGTTPAHDFRQAGLAQGSSDQPLPMTELLYRATEMPTNWPLYTEHRPSNLHQPFASVSPQPTLPNQPRGQSNLTSPFSDDFLATMNAANMVNPTEASSPDFNTPTLSNFGFGITAGPNSFQQPMVPQELWNMPMTFEWDWADMMNASMTQGLGQGSGGFDQMGADEVNNMMGGNTTREDEQGRQGQGRFL